MTDRARLGNDLLFDGQGPIATDDSNFGRSTTVGGGGGGTSDLQALLALIPEGPEYDMVRFSIQTVASIFPSSMGDITPERVQGWVNEIASGSGRDDDEIRSDIFNFIVGEDTIQNTLGTTPEETDALIAGTLTFSDLGRTATGGVETIGNATIPTGGTLIKVKNPEGSDAAALYYITYEWRGVQFAFEVGDKDRLEELFGGESSFDDKQTYNQDRFDSQDYVLSGSIDQHLGAEESFASLMEREVRSAGLEDMPRWIAESTEALTIMAQGSAQGWSSSRIWKELSGTDAFQQRFGDTIGLYTQGGGTIQDAVQQILADESALAAVVRRYQDAGSTVSEEYLQAALAKGWTAPQAAQVLEGTNTLVRNPTSLQQANEILVASGLEPTDEVGFINIIMGNTTDDVTEALNTAFAGQALTEAGIKDVDVNLLLDVIDTSDRVLSVDTFRETAQQLAFNFARFSTEIDRKAFGLNEDEITAALFGRESPSGKSAGEVLNTLARYERDRRAAAQGFGGAQAFVDDQGNLRFQGV